MNLARRKFLKAGAGSLALLAAGCDQLPREVRLMFLQPQDQGPFQPPSQSTVDPLVHVLNRAAFGARPGDYQRIRRLGTTAEEAAAAYLEQQLAPERIEDDEGDYAVRRFETLTEPLGELFEYQQELLQHELSRSTLARAVYSQRQLFEVMVEFWSDHFNVDPSKGDCKWLTVAEDRDVIRKHALGKFSELLRSSALSPAMLWYLDGRVNRRATPEDRPNENYARELLELHTLGVHGGYTQRDVMEAARCLTGWTVRSTERAPYFDIGRVEFQPAQHDFGAKELLGKRMAAAPAGLNASELERWGRNELDELLRLVTRHPATAQHLATKLCRHFIADEPPQGAVNQVATAFSLSDGDVRATLSALFGTEQFRSCRGNKFKRPFQFVASALRASGARTDAGLELIAYLARMGHAPFNYPTPEGYPDKAEPWMGSLLWRWNFAVALTQNQLKGTRLDIDRLRENVGGDDALMAHVLGRQASSEETRAYRESGAGLALLLSSPSFQRC